jgi:hypothetical protein
MKTLGYLNKEVKTNKILHNHNGHAELIYNQVPRIWHYNKVKSGPKESYA